MSAPIPTTEPTQLRAGETLQFKRTLEDYPANADPAWSIAYTFRCPEGGTSISFSSSADVADHLITVPFGTTASWKAGSYYGVALVGNGTTKKQIWEGRLEILPNLAAEAADYDPRTQARRTLDNINAVIEGRASSSVLKSKVNGTELERIPIADLLLLKDRYTQIVSREEAAAQGKPTRSNIYTRFTSPR